MIRSLYGISLISIFLGSFIAFAGTLNPAWLVPMAVSFMLLAV